MPDSTNEIVKIPTNEVGPSSKKKMAIIRAHNSKRFPEDGVQEDKKGEVSPSKSLNTEGNLKGFYSKKEFEDLKSDQKQVEVHRDVKAVRWADELEW